jgi:hypothetical protein
MAISRLDNDLHELHKVLELGIILAVWRDSASLATDANEWLDSKFSGAPAARAVPRLRQGATLAAEVPGRQALPAVRLIWIKLRSH